MSVSAEMVRRSVAVKPAQIGRDELERGRHSREDELPVWSVPEPAVDPQKRFAVAVCVVVQLHAIDVEKHASMMSPVATWIQVA